MSPRGTMQLEPDPSERIVRFVVVPFEASRGCFILEVFSPCSTSWRQTHSCRRQNQVLAGHDCRQTHSRLSAGQDGRRADSSRALNRRRRQFSHLGRLTTWALEELACNQG